MNKCRKCDRQMVVLFQTPKCEVCELGGPDVPRFWLTGSLKNIEEIDHGRVTVFQDKESAQRWATYVVEVRKSELVTFEATVAECNKLSFADPCWDTINDIKGFIGTRFMIADCFVSEAAAAARERIMTLPRFVLVKP